MANRDNIADQFMSILGRSPTKTELDHFEKFVQEGSLNPYEIGQALQASPEYQNTLLQRNTARYGDVLQGTDNRILQQAADIAGAQANSRFASLGRPVTSAQSAQVFGQTGQIASQLAQQRQAALAAFYGGGLQQNQGLYQAYGQNVLDRGYGLRDEARQFAHERDIYNLQHDAYQDSLNQGRRLQRNQALAGLGGALIGAGIGGAFGGGAGARLGAGIGGMSGGLF